MAEKEDFARLISAYQLSYGNELQAKVKRLDGIIGDRHWLSVGTYKENLVKGILRDRIPKKYEVGTGFVLTYREGSRVLSRQIDVLIWDCEDHSPLFREGEFVIVPPEACFAAIEVKATLTSASLRESLNNLDSLMNFFPDHHHLRSKVLHRSVFAFSLDGDLTFPDGVFNALRASYARSEYLSIDARTKFSKDPERWQLPWISSVSVLGVGNINCELWNVNDEDHVIHTAYRATAEDALDAYGFLERRLLMDLILGYQKSYARESRPGLTSLLFANKANPVQDQWYMPVENISITKVGRLSGEENAEWVSKAYVARQPRRTAKKTSKKTTKSKKGGKGK